MNTLVALLGHTPGAVTGSFYALLQHLGSDSAIARLVTVSTASTESERGAEMIAAELTGWLEGPAGQRIIVQGTPRSDEETTPEGHTQYWREWSWSDESGPRLTFRSEHIGAADLEDAESSEEFRVKVARVLARELDSPEQRVYLSLAGGRKSMTALAAIAAQLAPKPVEMMFHLYVQSELERHCEVNNLQEWPDWRTRCLRPSPEDYAFVPISFFHYDAGGQPRLQGNVDQFAYEYIHSRPVLLEQLLGKQEQVRIAYQSFHFEVKMADFLCEKGLQGQPYPQAWHHHIYPGHEAAGDIDVYAVRAEGEQHHVLMGECKLYFADPGNVLLDVGKVTEVHTRYNALQEVIRADLGPGPVSIRPAVFTNAWQVDGTVAQCARERGIELFKVRLPSNWPSSVQWDVQSIEPLRCAQVS